MNTKEEIKDFLDVNSQKDVIDYIFRLEADLKKYKGAVAAAQSLLQKTVSRDRYNDLMKEYKKLEKQIERMSK